MGFIGVKNSSATEYEKISNSQTEEVVVVANQGFDAISTTSEESGGVSPAPEIKQDIKQENVKSENLTDVNIINKDGAISKLPSNKKYSREEEHARIKLLNEKVNDIQLKVILQMLRAEPNQNNIRNKWKVRNSDGYVVGNVSITGQQWYNFNLLRGGVGAVSLIEHIEKLTWKNAVLWLAKEFGEDVDDSEIKAAKVEKTFEKLPFSPPTKVNKYIDLVRNYLVKERCLDKTIVNELIDAGKIYADEHKNCVFLSKSLAELRGINTDFKELQPGSSRIFGFTVMKPGIKPDAVCITEAAIKTIAYFMKNPTHFSISAAGCNSDFAIRVGNDCLKSDIKFLVGFDNDQAGHVSSQIVYNYFYMQKYFEARANVSAEEFYKLYKEKAIYFIPDDNQLFFSLPDQENKIKYTISVPKKVSSEVLDVLNKLYKINVKVGDNSVMVNPKGYDIVCNSVSRVLSKTKDWDGDLKADKESPQALNESRQKKNGL